MQTDRHLDKVNRLVQQAYDLFKKYKLQEPLKHSWPDNSAFLHAGGHVDQQFLQELRKPVAQLDQRCATIIASEGQFLSNIDDYKHFVPRVLELIVSQHYPPNVFSTLWLMDFSKWPPEEHNLLGDFCDSLWELVLDGEHVRLRADELGRKSTADDAIQFLQAVHLIRSVDSLTERWSMRSDEAAEKLYVDATIAIAKQIVEERQQANSGSTPSNLDPPFSSDFPPEPILIIASRLLNGDKTHGYIRDPIQCNKLGIDETDILTIKIATDELAKLPKNMK